MRPNDFTIFVIQVIICQDIIPVVEYMCMTFSFGFPCFCISTHRTNSGFLTFTQNCTIFCHLPFSEGMSFLMSLVFFSTLALPPMRFFIKDTCIAKIMFMWFFHIQDNAIVYISTVYTFPIFISHISFCRKRSRNPVPVSVRCLLTLHFTTFTSTNFDMPGRFLIHDRTLISCFNIIIHEPGSFSQYCFAFFISMVNIHSCFLRSHFSFCIFYNTEKLILMIAGIWFDPYSQLIGFTSRICNAVFVS